MDSKPMDKTAEERLIKAARTVLAYVEEDGCHPDEAVAKTAEDLGLEPTMLPILIQAYNIGRCAHQHQHGGPSILDKQAEFPIARIENVTERLYPENPPTPAQRKSASAIDPSYFEPPAPRPEPRPRFEKAASAAPAPVAPNVHQAFAIRDKQKRAVDAAWQDHVVARERYLGAMGQLTEYFKQASHWRKPYGEVEWVAQQQFGPPAVHALRYAHKQAALREPFATGPPSLLRAVDYSAAPYTLVEQAIDCGRAMLQTKRAHATAEALAETMVKEAMRPFDPNLEQPPPPGSILLGGGGYPCSRKSAGFLGNMAAVGIGAGGRSMFAPKPTDDLVGTVADRLSDPEHMAEIRGIQTRAMLSDLMNNDDVISGYDSDEVLNAYNELSQLSPRTANQPMVIRPLLRRHLTQGGVESMDAQQLADIENTIGQSSHESMPKMPKMSEVLHGSAALA